MAKVIITRVDKNSPESQITYDLLNNLNIRQKNDKFILNANFDKGLIDIELSSTELNELKTELNTSR